MDKRGLDRFIRVWNSSKSPHVAARKLGRKVASCSSTASQLRRLGYPIKNFKTESSQKIAALFIEGWNAAESVKAFAEKLRRPIRSVETMASILRRRGYVVKYFKTMPGREFEMREPGPRTLPSDNQKARLDIINDPRRTAEEI